MFFFFNVYSHFFLFQFPVTCLASCCRVPVWTGGRMGGGESRAGRTWTTGTWGWWPGGTMRLSTLTRTLPCTSSGGGGTVPLIPGWCTHSCRLLSRWALTNQKPEYNHTDQSEDVFEILTNTKHSCFRVWRRMIWSTAWSPSSEREWEAWRRRPGSRVASWWSTAARWTVCTERFSSSPWCLWVKITLIWLPSTGEFSLSL